MGVEGIVTTMFGGMLFPFLILMIWGQGAEEGGMFGGIAAGGLVVGTSWLANHGAGLVVQGQGAPWVDMAWAAGIGIMAFGIVEGNDLGKSIPSLTFAIIGGIIGGYVLSAL
ncbi:MAG: Lin0368 family putative glycerol transporter subunit [Bacillota bacterium]